MGLTVICCCYHVVLIFPHVGSRAGLNLGKAAVHSWGAVELMPHMGTWVLKFDAGYGVGRMSKLCYANPTRGTKGSNGIAATA